MKMNRFSFYLKRMYRLTLNLKGQEELVWKELKKIQANWQHEVFKKKRYMLNLFKGKNEMKISEAFDFWGLSEKDEKVKNFIKANNFDKTEIYISQKEYLNTKYTVSLLFKSVNLFENYYYKPEEIFTDTKEESFFIGFTIGDFFGKPKFPLELPFNLTLNDNFEEVKKKLNIPSSKATKTAEKSVYYQFNFSNFYVLTYFNLDDKLIYLVFKLFEASELKIFKLEKAFKILNKNLKTENISLLEKLKNENPTFQWKKRLLDGDDIFNDENILETSKRMDIFIENLQEALSKNNSKNIYNATKRFVKSLNRLYRFDYFIGTTEREEIFEFIDKCILITTGYELEKDFDITEEWRQW